MMTREDFRKEVCKAANTGMDKEILNFHSYLDVRKYKGVTEWYMLVDQNAGLYIEITSVAFAYLKQLYDHEPTTAVVDIKNGCYLKIVSHDRKDGKAISTISVIHKDCGVLLEREISRR